MTENPKCSERPVCPDCNTPMWKKELVAPLSDNPRRIWRCKKCGKTKTLPAPDTKK